jgi:transcription-repair coupling factor (superfamily II helicase)
MPTIDLPLSTYIPKNYVSDAGTRLKFYHQLAEIDNEEQVKVLKYDFKDRFGDIPQEVENLLYAIVIKLLAAKAGVESISTEDNYIILRPFSGMRFDSKKLQLVLKDGVEFRVIQLRLDYRKFSSQWKRIIEKTLKILGRDGMA